MNPVLIFRFEIKAEQLELPDLCKALFADVLSFELNNVCSVVAEDAGRLILAKNDVVTFYEDLDGIALGQVECVSQFLGDDYSSKLIQLSYDSRCFHGIFAPFFDHDTE